MLEDVAVFLFCNLLEYRLKMNVGCRPFPAFSFFLYRVLYLLLKMLLVSWIDTNTSFQSIVLAVASAI